MKTIILLDFDSLNEAVQKLDVEINSNEFLRFLKTIHEESEIQTAYAYVGIDEKLPHAKDKVIDELTRNGYIVRKVNGENFGMNFISDCSQAITLDALRCFYENNATNIIIVSKSNKLVNLVTVLREKDVSVETIFYGSLVDYELAVKSTGFINLDDFITDDEENDEKTLFYESQNSELDEFDDKEDPYYNMVEFKSEDKSESKINEIQEDKHVDLISIKNDDAKINIIEKDKGENN